MAWVRFITFFRVMPTTCWRATIFAIGPVLVGATAPALAQQAGDGSMPLGATQARDATPGSPSHRSLRLLSLLPQGWPFDSADSTNRVKLRWSDPQATLFMNTRRASSDRDGAIWQGRGATASLTGGIVLESRWLSVALRPVAYATQNLSYDSARAEREIDLPHRLRSRAFGAVDPGESWLRIKAGPLGFGATTASQAWGPASFYPLIFGTEGAGYPRLSTTVRHLNVGVGQLNGEWSMGVLEASSSSGLAAGARSRIGSGATFDFSPAGLPGLQLGVTRFFHLRRERNGFSWSNATFPFSGLVKDASRDVGIGGANQLASVFVRIAPQGSGVSVYGELLRDDHNVDLRDLIVEPDHASAFVVGMERAWMRRGELRAFTVERANGRYSHLDRLRAQPVHYTHVAITEGHTFRGQPLGSSALVGGGGTRVQFDRVGESRSRSAWFEIRALAQNAEGGTLDGKSVGSYALNHTEWRTRGSRTFGWRVKVEWLYGSNPAPNVLTSFSVR